MEKKEKKENDSVLLVLITGLLVIAFILKQNEEPKELLIDGLIIASTLIGLLNLISPKIGAYMAYAWLKFGHFLGWINSRIILTIVFYCILFPISLIFRLTNKDPLQRKKTSGSNFSTRNHLYGKKDLENIW